MPPVPPPKPRRRALKIALGAVAGLLLAAIIAFAGVMFALTRLAHALPELRPWHKTAPASEFTADQETDKYTFDDYLAQETKIYAELDELIRKEWAGEAVGPYSRYNPDSVCYVSKSMDHDWNRTIVLEAKEPKGGVLLLHGLSDGPYSVRLLGEQLHKEGYTVIFLRIPGHGTSPKALADVSWKDWTAAVRIAMTGLRKRVPVGLPLIMVGYSNGGALSVNHVAEALTAGPKNTAPIPDALVLISPMIGISPLAELTELYPFISKLTGEEKLSWAIIEPEIDPFKFSSSPVSAGLQAHRLTQHMESAIAQLAADGCMANFPPVLTVQSSADSTVVAHRMIDILMDRLPPGPSELILFDINRADWLDGLTGSGFERNIRPRIARENLPFALTMVTNRSETSKEVVARTIRDGKTTETDIGYSWPSGIFSLSHVALSISPTDPIYGSDSAQSPARIPLGSLSLRGESGVLSISPRHLMRQRYNPFYTWTEQRILDWILERKVKAPK